MDKNIFYGLVIFIIFVLIYFIYKNIFKHIQIYDKLINGFYESDDSFCSEAGIDMFCLYIDDDVDSDGNRASYILMNSNENLIINEPTIAKIVPKWEDMWFSDPNLPKLYSIEFKDLSTECADIFPANQTLRFYPTIGKIVLFDDDIITGVFYKNGIQTELKSILEE
jgi:hypothetical protein